MWTYRSLPWIRSFPSTLLLLLELMMTKQMRVRRYRVRVRGGSTPAQSKHGRLLLLVLLRLVLLLRWVLRSAIVWTASGTEQCDQKQKQKQKQRQWKQRLRKSPRNLVDCCGQSEKAWDFFIINIELLYGQ